MTFISHRGAAGLAKENSLDAIKIAHSMRPTYIEVDINHTKDGVFVLYHGPLHRTYVGVSLDQTYHSLKSKIPELLTLDEFIKFAPRRPFMLDIKVRTVNDDLIKAMHKVPAVMRKIFTSPHPKTLVALKNAFPESKTYVSQPYSDGPIRPIALARKYNFDGICLNKWWIGPLVVRACKLSKKDIFTYTIDRSVTMKIIKKLFPKVVIITNRPDKYRKIFLSK